MDEIVNALKVCLGAMENLKHQIMKMKDTFDDQDGSISESLLDYRYAVDRANSALSKLNDMGKQIR